MRTLRERLVEHVRRNIKVGEWARRTKGYVPGWIRNLWKRVLWRKRIEKGPGLKTSAIGKDKDKGKIN